MNLIGSILILWCEGKWVYEIDSLTPGVIYFLLALVSSSWWKTWSWSSARMAIIVGWRGVGNWAYPTPRTVSSGQSAVGATPSPESLSTRTKSQALDTQHAVGIQLINIGGWEVLPVGRDWDLRRKLDWGLSDEKQTKLMFSHYLCCFFYYSSFSENDTHGIWCMDSQIKYSSG